MSSPQLSMLDRFKKRHWLAKTGIIAMLAISAVFIWPLLVLAVYWLVLGTLRDRKWRYILTAVLLGPALMMQGYWSRPVWQQIVGSAQSSNQTASQDQASQPSVQGASTSRDNGVKVLQVISGDSFDVDDAGQAYRVKLIGVLAPTTATESTGAACYAQESMSFLSSLLQGQSVTLNRDSGLGDKDAQGRLLRYATIKDGTDVNQLLLESGLAKLDDSQAFSRQIEFTQLVSAAQASLKGMWAVCAPPATPTPAVATKAASARHKVAK